MHWQFVSGDRGHSRHKVPRDERPENDGALTRRRSRSRVAIKVHRYKDHGHLADSAHALVGGQHVIGQMIGLSQRRYYVRRELRERDVRDWMMHLRTEYVAHTIYVVTNARNELRQEE